MSDHNQESQKNTLLLPSEINDLILLTINGYFNEYNQLMDTVNEELSEVSEWGLNECASLSGTELTERTEITE